MNLIFLGAPGAGKGTLALKAASFLSVPHISTGGIFRDAIKAKTELGLKVQSVISQGKLVEDDLTIALVRERLQAQDARAGWILDGFPRNIVQADALNGFAKTDGVINFNLSDEAVIGRLSGRLICKKCGASWHKIFNPTAKEGICDLCGGEVYVREDDKPEAIKKRLEVYREQTQPLIDYYKKLNLLINLDASPAIEEVFENFKTILKTIKSGG